MTDQKRRRVALGMSGGVDSSLSADLLMRAGFEVVGVTCRFHDNEATDQAIADAAAVCRLLGIKHVQRDCVSLFSGEVIKPFVNEYASGLTPCPCIECNARCKIPALVAVADALDCDCFATGHYARIAQLSKTGRFAVLSALDARKDQSYMLAMLTQQQLSRFVLPLGAMTKAEVRIHAFDLKLPVAEKAESQDVCFIEGDYRTFLREQGVEDAAGLIVNRAGDILGHHQGLANFTVGQRKGIGIAAPTPYYVIEKRLSTAELVVGFAQEALISVVRVAHPNWQAFERLEGPLDASVKLRYRSQATACSIEPDQTGGVRVLLRSPQPTTAPGQYAVFYEGDTVLGGGMIEEVG